MYDYENKTAESMHRLLLREPHKVVKHTQTIRPQFATENANQKLLL